MLSKLRMIAIVAAIGSLVVIGCQNKETPRNRMVAETSQQKEPVGQCVFVETESDSMLDPLSIKTNTERRQKVEQSIKSGETVWGNQYLSLVPPEWENAVKITRDGDGKVSTEVLQGVDEAFDSIGEELLVPEGELFIYRIFHKNGEKECAFEFVRTPSDNHSKNLEMGRKNYFLDENKKYIVSVGSVGQPRDYDNRASFVVFDSDKRHFEFKRIEYDIESAAEKVLGAKLERNFAHRLYIGV